MKTATPKAKPLTDAQAAKAYGLPVSAVRMLRRLPNFDPFALAQPGDRFDLSYAGRVCDLFEAHIKYPEGPKAGQPFKLEPWQECILANFYGWRHSSGRRRFSEVLIYVPKKNGKTTFTAGWLLIDLVFLAGYGAQFYSAAGSKDQAALVFQCCAKMLDFDEELKAACTVFGKSGAGQQRSIYLEAENKSYKPMSADANTADGCSPDFTIADELHRHKKPELVEVLEKSSAAKPESVVIKTTTADYDRPSICNATLKRARDVLANHGDMNAPGYDPSFLPAVFEIPQEEYKANPDIWQDLDAYERVNPSFGVTVDRAFYVKEVQRAKDDPSQIANLLRLHLNIVTTNAEVWLDMGKYDACQDPRTDNELIGESCWGGLDLSATEDLTAFALLWTDTDNQAVDCKAWFWLPEEPGGNPLRKKEDRDGVPYSSWVASGWLELTPGQVVDYRFVEQRIMEIRDQYNIQDIGCDPWQSASTMNTLNDAGIECVKFGQGAAYITEPGKDLERHIIKGTFRHGGNPILRWNMSNAQKKICPGDTFRLDKETPAQRIDGVAAVINANGRRMLAEKNTGSVYEEREMVML